ncbi:hypothetical protein F5887DRAFT_451768 [Amanita rubescens]|nr:hypothetical protein F5887DRAFT_451768 [Amanita rubescens]
MHSIHIRLSFLLLMHAFVSATPIAIRQGSSMIAARRIYPGDPANHHGQASTLNVHHSALRTRSDIVNSSGSDGNFAAGSSSSSGSSSARVGAPSTGQTYTGTVSGVTPIQGTGNDTGRTAGQVTVGNDVEVTVVLGGGTSEPTNPSGSQGDNGSKSGDASTGSTNGSTNPNGGAQGNNGQGSGESANTVARPRQAAHNLKVHSLLRAPKTTMEVAVLPRPTHNHSRPRTPRTTMEAVARRTVHNLKTHNPPQKPETTIKAVVLLRRAAHNQRTLEIAQMEQEIPTIPATGAVHRQEEMAPRLMVLLMVRTILTVWLEGGVMMIYSTWLWMKVMGWIAYMGKLLVVSSFFFLRYSYNATTI